VEEIAMAWWNPLSWFSKEVLDPKTATVAQVLESVKVREEGVEETVDEVKDGVAPADKYLFEIQTILATQELVRIAPKGDDRNPWGLSDRKPPFEIRDVLLTLEEAARLLDLSKSHSGDGLAKTAAEVLAKSPPPPAPPMPPEAKFSAAALEKARPDKILAAKIEDLGV
jgi:hypothetical protein